MSKIINRICWLPAFYTAVAFIAIAVLTSCSQKAPFEREDYGLGKYIYSEEIDSWTEDIKEEQRKNGAEFLTQLEEAIASGATELNLDKPHYRFNANSLGGRIGSYITIRKANNLTINGNGAQFWFDTFHAAMSVDSCKDLVFKDLSLDWDPLPYTQIVVTAVDSMSITGRTEEGFLDMTEILSSPGVRNPDIKSFVFDAKSGLLKPDVAHTSHDSVTDLKDHHNRFWGVGYGGYRYNRQNIKPGDRMAVVMRHTHGVRIRRSENVSFINFNMYSSPMFGISMSDGGGGLVIRNSKIVPRPGTKRLMSVNGDGIHLTSLTRGPLIEDSEFSAAGDDIMNIHGDFGMIQKQIDSNKVLIAVKNFRNIFDGSSINLYDYNTLARKGSFKVLKVEDAGQDSRMDARAIGREKRVKFWPGNGSIICVLDKPVEVSRYDIVESMEDGGYGAIIRNNILHNCTTRGFLLQTKDALIENNTFWHIDNAAAAMMASLDWCEAPFPENITFRNNTITNVNIGLGSRYADHAKMGAVSVNIEYTGKLKQSSKPIRGIVIENNRISNAATSGIFMIHSRDSRIMNNSINGFCEFPPLKMGKGYGIEPFAGIFIDDSEQIEVDRNIIEQAGKYSKENIILGSYSVKESIKINR